MSRSLTSLSLSLSLFSLCNLFHAHHEFTSEESQMSLHALGLYPSASLVISMQSVGGTSAVMETGPSHSIGSSSFPAPRGSKTVSFGREQMMAASSHINRTLIISSLSLSSHAIHAYTLQALSHCIDYCCV